MYFWVVMMTITLVITIVTLGRRQLFRELAKRERESTYTCTNTNVALRNPNYSKSSGLAFACERD